MNKKLYKNIIYGVGRAISEFNMIQNGDKIAVAVSGGKDSYTLIDILEDLRRRAPVKFELMAINIDSGYPGYRSDIIADYLKENGFACHIEKTDHYEVINQKREPGSSYCSFCSRLKRGTIYTLAQKFGCNKIALGHHLDDFIETLLLNQFYTGSIKAMSPNMLADNRITTVIRPLVYVEERDIIKYSREKKFPVVCCCCPVCGTADLKRKMIKTLLAGLEKDNPLLKRSMIKALSNVHPRHLLDLNLEKRTIPSESKPLIDTENPVDSISGPSA